MAKKTLGTGPVIRWTDEQILDMRSKAEFEGWTTKQIADHYKCGLDYMYKILEYSVRAKLIPKRPRTK